MTLPNYEGTADEYARYGNRLSIWQQLALLQAWAPLIGFAQRFVNETDPYKKGIVVSDACEWLASKTSAQADDELVRHVATLLRTKEGEALVRWVLLQIEGMQR
jgi:hypothetical protein